MAFTPFVSGQVLTASGLNAALGWIPVTITKSADQSRTNNTGLVDDTELFFTPAINTTYKAQWDLFYSGTTAGDGKIALTFPAGSTCPWGYQGYDINLAFSSIAFDTTVASATTFSIGGSGATNSLLCRITATVTMGSTAGSIRLQFAQVVAAAATSMTVRQGSTLTYHRIA